MRISQHAEDCWKRALLDEVVLCPEELAAGCFGFASGRGVHKLREGELAGMHHEDAMGPWVLFTGIDVVDGGRVRPSLGICGPKAPRYVVPRPHGPPPRAGTVRKH